MSFLLAQCVMCYRTAAAQQLERARVLNSGIIVLLIPPLLVLTGILLLAYRRSSGRRLTVVRSARDNRLKPVPPSLAHQHNGGGTGFSS